VIVASLKHLEKNDHLLILEQVEGITVEMIRVFAKKFFKLSIELLLHGLEEVTITDCVFGIRTDRCDL
jgi:hypothetical protein